MARSAPPPAAAAASTVAAAAAVAAAAEGPLQSNRQVRRNPRENALSTPTPRPPSPPLSVRLRGQLRTLLALRCLRSAHLSTPVFVPYLNSGVGLSAPGILWLGSFYSLLVIIAEMPSGYLSDRLGRRRTLRFAFGALGLAPLAAAAAASSSSPGSDSARDGMIGSWVWLRPYVALAVAQALRAVGSALFSGTDMAFLYETLRRYRGAIDSESDSNEKDGEDDGKRESLCVTGECLSVESVHVFASSVSESASSALGGALAEQVGLRATVAASSVPFLAGAALCLFLDEAGEADGGKDSVELAKGEKKSSSASEGPPDFRSLLRIPPNLRRIFMAGIAINCGTYLASTAINPLLWTAAGVRPMHFGWIGACSNAVSAGSALAAPILRRLVSRGSLSSESLTERLLVSLLVISSSAYVLLTMAAWAAGDVGSKVLGISAVSFSWAESNSGASPILAVAGALLLSAVRGLAWPVLGAAVNGAVSDNSLRATFLSVFAALVKVGLVGAGFVLGLVLEKGSERGGDSVGLCGACGLCSASLAIVAMFMVVEAIVSPHGFAKQSDTNKHQEGKEPHSSSSKKEKEI